MYKFLIPTENAIRELKALKPHLKGMSIVGSVAYDMAINALDKQIPRKVKADQNCPDCGRDVVGSGFYCWNCGQRLDWGDE